jgi:hypothetical protein
VVPQGGEALEVMGVEVLPNVYICAQLDVFAADPYRDDLCVAQRGREAATSQGAMDSEGLAVLDDNTVDSDTERISVHWTGPPVRA